MSTLEKQGYSKQAHISGELMQGKLHQVTFPPSREVLVLNSSVSM